MTSRTQISLGLLVIVILLVTTEVLAYESSVERLQELIENTSPEARAEFQTHKMKKRLYLKEDQVKRVQEINLEHARKVQHVVESHDGRFREFRELRELGKHKDRELKSVLTADQYSDYLDMKNEMRERLMDFTEH